MKLQRHQATTAHRAIDSLNPAVYSPQTASRGIRLRPSLAPDADVFMAVVTRAIIRRELRQAGLSDF
jgi:hypothetical protein